MKVTLNVIDGPHKGATFEFLEHDAFLVGRSPEVQFRLPLQDKTLSRVHFLVEVNPPSCRLMDMASTNGVRVNGKKVHTVDLRDGDLIEAGGTVLAVAVESAEDEGVEASAPQAKASFITPGPGHPTEVPTFPGYRVERLLGEGGMGRVYLARREADDSSVALKVVKPALAAREPVLGRFLREASILRKIEHPNIVRFHDLGFDEGRLYFAMESVDGTSLAEVLTDRGPLSIPAASGVCCQVLRALDHAQARGFVHRDIKPGNLLKTRAQGKSIAKLADFGLAKVYQESSLSGLSVTGQIGGTLAFMPPEQITHFREARPPADLYALGATLYTLLTGRPIFEVAGRPELQVARILFEKPVPIRSYRPEVPDALATAIHKALARSPADRFPGVRAMRDALAPFAKPRRSGPDPPRPPITLEWSSSGSAPGPT